MKSLLSINYRFFDITPKELVEMVLESKYTKGIEVYVDVLKEEELKYLDDLVFYMNKNDLKLQIHSAIDLDFDIQLKYMKKLESYSDLLGYPINVTLHSIYDENIEVSINKTTTYLLKLIDNVDNNKLVICLENLNDLRDRDRLGVKDIREAILNSESLYFTYDIGHELADYGNVTDIDTYLLNDMRNVHVHTVNDEGYEHMPIYKEDKYWENILKAILYLKLNNYNYDIVFEYGLQYCRGVNNKERLKDYLASIDYVSERFN